MGKGGAEFAIYHGLLNAFLKVNRRMEVRMEKDGMLVVGWKEVQE